MHWKQAGELVPGDVLVVDDEPHTVLDVVPGPTPDAKIAVRYAWTVTRSNWQATDAVIVPAAVDPTDDLPAADEAGALAAAGGAR